MARFGSYKNFKSTSSSGSGQDPKWIGVIIGSLAGLIFIWALLIEGRKYLKNLKVQSKLQKQKKELEAEQLELQASLFVKSHLNHEEETTVDESELSSTDEILNEWDIPKQSKKAGLKKQSVDEQAKPKKVKKPHMRRMIIQQDKEDTTQDSQMSNIDLSRVVTWQLDESSDDSSQKNSSFRESQIQEILEQVKALQQKEQEEQEDSDDEYYRKPKYICKYF